MGDDSMNGVNVSKYNMGYGMGFDNVQTEQQINRKISSLQKKAKDGVEKVVENEAYTTNNPSLTELQYNIIKIVQNGEEVQKKQKKKETKKIESI